ncbi:MAG: hypothetical protein AAB563_00775 [Patescibacteria group bacterium]
MIDQMLSIFLGRARADVTDITLKLPNTLVDESGGSSILQNITDLAFAFLATMAFVGIIYSGVMMITAGGDATKFAAGKKNLLWSIIGIMIVVLSYFIIRLVYQLGIDILTSAAKP